MDTQRDTKPSYKTRSRRRKDELPEAAHALLDAAWEART